MKKLKIKGIYQLFILMILVSLLFAITSIVIMYKIVYKEKRMFLQELCENQQDIIQSIYKETNDVNTVLKVLYKQQKITNGLGTTGEYAIAYSKNDSIFFLLRMRQNVQTNYLPISIKSNKAIPLQYALSKNTGFIHGLDYKGNLVLAYCTYIPELKWGLVTKMDISEVRLPFYKAGIYAIISSIILILIATILFRKVAHPITKKIEESEENYRRLFEYSAIPIWKEDYSEIKKHFDKLKYSGVTDFRTYFEAHKDEINYLASQIKVLEINQKSVEFYRAESKEDVIKNMLFYFNEASLDVFREEMIVLAEGVKRFECEMPIRILSGDIKILSLHLSVVKGFEDTLSNVLVSFIDITENKKKEKELHKLNRTLSALSKSSQEMTRATDESVYLDEVCKIIINDCGYAMLWIGYAEDDEGKTVKPVAFSGFEEGYLETLNITWADMERGNGPTGTAIRTGKPAMCKNMLTDPAFKPWREDAIKRGYASSIVLPLIADNKTFGAISIYSKEPDSFTNDEVELLLELANNLSYGIISIRSRIAQKEAEEALRKKNAELVEINATKDKFFKIIAHDMKNPFISLLGASELLYENAHKYDSDKITKLTKILNDSAKSGYDMLLNLLEWSRSQAGSMIFQLEKINLKELINKNLSNLTEYASSKKINLNIDIASDMQVYADKNMLNTILRNLINNALKFTPKGGDVTVSTKNKNGSIIILVKDTGIGIDKSDFDKLFRTDIKFSKPGTELEGGTGLGLLLCKEFVEKHGGKIWAESDPEGKSGEKGSTFYFSLNNTDAVFIS